MCLEKIRIPFAWIHVHSVRRNRSPLQFAPHLQFNLKTGYADNGAQADIANSGGTIVYASPGVTFNLPNQAQLFTFVQVPVFQALNGYQLAPTLVVSTGIRFTF